MHNVLPKVDAQRVVACRSFETRGVLYSAYDLTRCVAVLFNVLQWFAGVCSELHNVLLTCGEVTSTKGLATLLELRNSVFSLRYWKDLNALASLDDPEQVLQEIFLGLNSYSLTIP